MSQPVVYFARCTATANGADMGAIKVGCTRNVRGRLLALKSGEPFECEAVATCPGEFFEEAVLHAWLRADCIRGEYFYDRGEVRRLADLAAETGEMPIPFVRREVRHTWITMAEVDYFTTLCALTRDEIISLSGLHPHTYDARVKQRVPSRFFVAHLVAAAIRKGFAVTFDDDVLDARPIPLARAA